MNELIAFDQENLTRYYKACETLSKSTMIPISLRGKPQDIFAILIMGGELGIKPMQAIQSINVIQGKPTISPQLMIALIKGKLNTAIIKVELDSEKNIAKCTTARSKEEFNDGFFFVSEWNLARAEMMGLSGKDNYKKQLLTMLKWRAVAESCRTTFPDILMGLYATDEMYDFDGKPIKTLSEKDDPDSDLNRLDPRTEEQKRIGPHMVMIAGKFKGKEIGEFHIDEVIDYRETLQKRAEKGSVKQWEEEAMQQLDYYIDGFESGEFKQLDEI